MSNIELCSYSLGFNQEYLHYPQCRCDKLKKSTSFQQVYPIDTQSCFRSQKWKKRAKLPPNPDIIYRKLVNLASNSPEISQLNLDISRTFSQIEYFSSDFGKKILSRLLHAFCAYSPSLGYVQGMNYIAATLLWHANEVDAFWLFVVLIEDFELRDNFISGLSGLNKHYHALDFLIHQNFPQIYTHLLNLNIAIPMFTTEWLITLFTSCIPFEESFRVMSKFFKYGWVFLYKVCLEIISRLSGQIIQSTNFALILNILKPSDHSDKESLAFLKSMEKNREKISWKKIIKEAARLDIDERFLHRMLHNAFSTPQGDV